MDFLAPWSAPEVLQSGKYSSASDVWGFGVIAWELITCFSIVIGSNGIGGNNGDTLRAGLQSCEQIYATTYNTNSAPNSMDAEHANGGESQTCDSRNSSSQSQQDTTCSNLGHALHPSLQPYYKMSPQMVNILVVIRIYMYTYAFNLLYMYKRCTICMFH